MDLLTDISPRFDDKDVQRDRTLVPYNIVNKDGKPYIQIKVKYGETKVFSPEEISVMVLTKMKETTEAFLGEKVKNVVIIVPETGYKGCWHYSWSECLGFLLLDQHNEDQINGLSQKLATFYA